MQLHTFQARSLAEALRLVRDELGPEASVLHTREVGGTLARWLGGRTIEVTASAEVAAPSRLPTAVIDALSGGAEPVASHAHLENECRLPAAELYDYRGRIRAELFAASGDEPSLVEQLARSPILPSRPATWNFGPETAGSSSCISVPWRGLAGRLQRAGASEQTVHRWLARLEAVLPRGADAGEEQILDHLRHIVAAELSVRGPIVLRRAGDRRPRVVALVGPTGVGKTTTLAKLAAHFQFHDHLHVGLLTADVFRIAAVEQLRAYAAIMNLPMEVVASTDEVPGACARLSNCDVVLLDTAGCSPHDAPRLSELRKLLDVVHPDDVQLVVSCVAHVDGLEAATGTFAALGAGGMILTKLDEQRQPGRLAEWLTSSRLPLCYTTHGQNVPGDLRPASALGLATLLIP